MPISSVWQRNEEEIETSSIIDHSSIISLPVLLFASRSTQLALENAVLSDPLSKIKVSAPSSRETLPLQKEGTWSDDIKNSAQESSIVSLDMVIVVVKYETLEM